MNSFPKSIYLIVALCVLAISDVAHTAPPTSNPTSAPASKFSPASPSKPSPTPTSKSSLSAGEDPSLKKFADAITFAATFDEDSKADISLGAAKPMNTYGDATFVPGLYGNALQLDKPANPKEGEAPVSVLCVVYHSDDNVKLSAPGSMVMWICPIDDLGSEPIGYYWPITVMVNGEELQMARQWQNNGGNRQESSNLFAKTEKSPGITLGAPSAAHWNKGEWHLLVANWEKNGISYSVDGKTPTNLDMKEPFKADDDHGLLIIGQQGLDRRYLIDGFMLLNRPLDETEIQWIYDQGMEAVSRK